jgi:primosomal protein N' (replication factor Y)
VVWDSPADAEPVPNAQLKPVRSVLEAAPLDARWRRLVAFAATTTSAAWARLRPACPALRDMTAEQLARRLAPKTLSKGPAALEPRPWPTPRSARQPR